MTKVTFPSIHCNLRKENTAEREVFSLIAQLGMLVVTKQNLKNELLLENGIAYLLGPWELIRTSNWAKALLSVRFSLIMSG
jgi:hypothetical protein